MTEIGRGDDFFCYGNKLTTLEGAPQSVEGNFNCEDNPLKSYKGKPSFIGGEFYAPEILLNAIMNKGIER